jgi:hypothetical protein
MQKPVTKFTPGSQAKTSHRAGSAQFDFGSNANWKFSAIETTVRSHRRKFCGEKLRLPQSGGAII